MQWPGDQVVSLYILHSSRNDFCDFMQFSDLKLITVVTFILLH